MTFDNTLLDALLRIGKNLTDSSDELLQGKSAAAGTFAAWLRQNAAFEPLKALEQAASYADTDPGAAIYLLASMFEVNRDRAMLARAGASASINRTIRALISKLAKTLTRDALLKALVMTPPASPSLGFSRFSRKPIVGAGPPPASPLPDHLLPGRPLLGAPLSDALMAMEKARPYAVLAQPLPRVRRPEFGALRQTLIAEFPWLEAAIDNLLGPIRIGQLAGQPYLRLPPLLIAGPPGIGKSALVRRLAEATRLPLSILQAAAGHEASALTGLSRTWRASEPSFPVRCIVAAGVANPLIGLDELDKSVIEGGGQFGKLVDALLPMLERSTANAWPDPFLGASVDLADVNWVLTVNDPRVLPDPLLSRLKLVRANTPTGDHAKLLIERQRSELAKEAGRSVDMIPTLSPEAELRIARDLDQHRDIRRLQRLVSAALSASEWPAIH
jgi:hypothetical protein